MNEILDVNEALMCLKEKIIVKDNKSIFKYKRKRIYVYSSNTSYSLSYKDFLELYKESKFVVVDDNNVNVDIEKDREYYAFKHK